MVIKRKVARKIPEKCFDFGACRKLVACPGGEEGCVGCGSCAALCPNSAIEMVEVEAKERVVIEVEGSPFEVPARITVREALERLGFHITRFPEEEGLFMPCQTGGCWACALEIDGELKRACLSAVKEGMRIKTSAASFTPRRIVGAFSAHPIGGVGTPWQIKALKQQEFVEVACFACGCNFRCPQCQNWTVTYLSRGNPLTAAEESKLLAQLEASGPFRSSEPSFYLLTPEEAARPLTTLRRMYGVNRMAISGGESTLNRRWLVQFIRELKQLNPEAHFNVDTNGSILTTDYLDELVEAGLTDIGIDLKALQAQTFRYITGLEDEGLAEKYKETAWKAVEYLLKSYPQVFVGIGIPYNHELIELAEVEEMGRRISQLNSEVQVTVLDYRPEFRRFKLSHPSYPEMARVHQLLKSTGLKTVLCQTTLGHIGPYGDLLR